MPGALRSLENQTLDKAKFEVIVVKNFEDELIDGYIRRLGFKNIVYDTHSLTFEKASEWPN